MTKIPVNAIGFDSTQLLGDANRGIAVLVDPPANPDPWMQTAARHDLRIRHVIITGQAELELLGYQQVIAETGAQLYLGGALESDLSYLRLYPGDVLEFGCLRITAAATDSDAVQLNLTCMNEPLKNCASEFAIDASR